MRGRAADRNRSVGAKSSSLVVRAKHLAVAASVLPPVHGKVDTKARGDATLMHTWPSAAPAAGAAAAPAHFGGGGVVALAARRMPSTATAERFRAEGFARATAAQTHRKRLMLLASSNVKKRRTAGKPDPRLSPYYLAAGDAMLLPPLHATHNLSTSTTSPLVTGNHGAQAWPPFEV